MFQAVPVRHMLQAIVYVSGSAFVLFHTIFLHCFEQYLCSVHVCVHLCVPFRQYLFHTVLVWFFNKFVNVVLGRSCVVLQTVHLCYIGQYLCVASDSSCVLFQEVLVH